MEHEAEAVTDWEGSESGVAPEAPATPQAAVHESPEAPPAEREEPSALPAPGTRDERGRFRGRQSARPQDAPRISQLTQRLRDTERKLQDAESRANARPAAPAGGGTSPTAPAAEVAALTPPVLAPPKFEKPRPLRPTLKAIQDANPSLDDAATYAKYESELEKHEQAVDAWRDEKSDFDVKVKEAATVRQQAEEKITNSWKERVAKARGKYTDFDEIALNANTKIPPGSLVDAWVLEHKYGADVLYHLQSHADDLDQLLRLTPIEQAEELTLLGQRLNGQSRPRSDAPTGSPPRAESRQPAPRPPNPVRTGPVTQARDPAPGDDSSLEDHEQYFESNPRLRRSRR